MRITHSDSIENNRVFYYLENFFYVFLITNNK